MTQVTFDEIQVTTPDPAAVEVRYNALRATFDAAADKAARMAALEAWNELRSELQTWSSYVSLRFSQATDDPVRKAALEERDNLSPKLQELELAFMTHIRKGPHAAEVAEHFGQHLLDLWACATASYDPSIEAETIAESKASSEYTALVSSARFEFQGETLTLSMLGKYSQHPDRDVRHEATRLRWGWFQENSEALDRIYDELVALRVKQAEALGYDSYVDLAYRKMGRTDYNKSDVARYRSAVLEHVVPLCTRIRERQRERLGLDELMGWDEPIQDLAGNPKPKGDHDWMVSRAREMFDAMGTELGSFFQLMVDGSLIDLKSREGKAGGGFCTSFPKYGVPFIFANFNGTKGDVKVLTHEIGHAFQNYSSRGQSIVDYQWPTSEAAEVHSMSLEFLTYPHMDKFFEGDAERFRQVHLMEALLFLPYGVAVDHFQQEVYENPKATPAERLAMWQRLEKTYLPHRNWGDIERTANGGYWQGQLHIYKYPFYYIDYTLAQVCAMQFWVRAEHDRKEAMEAYVRLCARGGEAPFQDLVRSAGLVSPFDEGCLSEVVATASRTLGL